jgi:PA14 domain
MIRSAPNPPSRLRRFGGAGLLTMALGIAALAGIGRAALGVSHGLSAEYFDNPDRAGTPASSGVDLEPSTYQLSHRWRAAPPETFSARWRGYLAVNRSDLYRFATTSDDGSWVYVDGRLVVDNGGTHGPLTRSGQIFLERGPHFVLVEYFQAGGPLALEWSWARDAAPLVPVPAWLLSQRRASYATAVAARVLEWVLWIALTAAVTSALILALPYARRLPPLGVVRQPRLAALALFILLAVLHTWPLATDPAHLSRNENGDTVLNTWIVAWVIHAAPRAPLHLFDANIFYPERNTLAYSEALLVQSAMGAPLVWAGASPVLTYNILLIAGFALTGWAMCLVLVRWTGDWFAALAGGIVMGFNAHTLTRMPHLQAQHVEFLPFALLALDRLLVEPRVRHALSFAAWFALQALASFYLLVIASVGLAAAVLVRPDAWAGKRALKVIGCLAVAGGVAGLLLLPYLLPYWSLNHGGFKRPIEEVAGFAASWRDYLTTPGRFPRLFIARWATGNALYPGAAAFALAALAVGSGVALRDPRPRMCLALGLAGVLFSFGPALPGYAWLYGAFTPLQGIRAVSRFGYLGIVAVAVLAAYGVVNVRGWMRDRSWSPTALAAILGVLALEPLAAPVYYSPYSGIPNIYDRVAQDANAIVVELPLPMPRGAFFNAPFMLNSTVHWKPMVNGYSGFVPDSYVEHYKQLHDFPAPETIPVLQRLGVTHAFVHLGALGPAKSADLDRTAGLLKVAAEGDIVLYQVAGRSSVHK